MSKYKSILITGLCLAVVITVLYGRAFIFRNPPPSSHQPSLIKQPAENVITMHYHERAPYYVTGPYGVYGLCADPAKLVLMKAGIPFRWQKTPAKRQLNIIKSNKMRECLLGWFKTPKREKFAKYTQHIYQDKPSIALARADNKQIISGRPLEETFSNPNLILLRKDSYSYGQFVDEKIAELNPKHEITADENIGMLRMIHSKRADYFFVAEEEAEELIVSSGLPKSDFKYVRFSNMPKGNKRYILFSKKVEDEVIEKINAAIKIYVHGSSGT
jgi:polar amino acid transport system substrate-binding protein